MMRLLSLGCLAGLLMLGGCASVKTSNTARTAKEQLLISNSIDQALNKVDFSAFGGSNVFIEEKYLDCVDKPYLVGSVRHRVLRGGARLVEKADAADIILEVRSGGVGTNASDMFVGSPELAVPGPFPVSLPEIRLLSKQEQVGIAKIGIVAFDAKTGRMLGDGGVTIAQSDDNNWYLLGAGPYQRGTIKQEIQRGTEIRPTANQPLPYNIAFDEPKSTAQQTAGPPPGDPGRVQWANAAEEPAPFPPAAPPAPSEFGNK